MSIDLQPPPPENDVQNSRKITALLDELFRRLLVAYETENIPEADATKLKEKKEWLIGSKLSLIEAIIALQTLELKQAETTYKMGLQNAKHEKRGLAKEDLRIIEQFLANHTPECDPERTDNSADFETPSP